MKKNNHIINFLILQFAFIIFSLSSIFVKLASCSEQFSIKFFVRNDLELGSVHPS